MISYSAIADRTARDHLEIFGAFHPAPGDGTSDGCATLILLGPSEPGFWPYVTGLQEFADQAPDPLDRWSHRVITRIAQEFDAEALFPFTGPPWQPFVSWAQKSGRAWQSPVSLLVHDTAGLMVSFRGALALPRKITLPAPPTDTPCRTCPQPCRTACPVHALTPTGYDTAACHGFLDTADGHACLGQGCAVRRACPLSGTYGRLPTQSGWHMKRFHP